ncbi:hydroxyacid dehydrogenase [Weissella coleopterorum]|uniref:Hydroxyacid dehydrogenase n=1 Tax=Weissella coleopterorum TaxID=2714949 RepID=A0A6G8B1S8_9LACO|nr:D-isomer specific 2-hydroxyacid dehydrogenase family protein [Weissella coleopterorum]QIL51182.1 hydroxyacid dehydrogenase [Weissella coleopterorum]
MPEYKIALVNSNSFGKIYPEHIQRLEKIGTVQRFIVDQQIPGKELAELLHGFNIIIASVTPNFTREFFENKDELLLLSRHGIGYNNVDVPAAREHGTLVTLVSQLVERDAVAENAFTNLLAITRRTVAADSATHKGDWSNRADFQGTNFTGKTYGVIGCGNIGSRVAELFLYAFNGRVLVADPEPHAADGWFEANPKIEHVSLETLLKESDFISLNASLNATSEEIINTDSISLMKDGVYITNAARGALINEPSLLNAIESGKIAGYGTDTMIEEPVQQDHPFLKNNHIIVTPHTSAYTDDCLHAMGEKCVSDVENFINHQPLVREITLTDELKNL